MWKMMMMVKWVCIMLVLVNWASANSDGDVLIALKNNLTDPNQVLDSWDPDLVDPCTYFHVTCDSDNRVIRLELYGSNLSGHLIPDLGNLERLQYLELFENNIQGSIPPELGNLKNLISLDLYNNNISGIIPPELGKLNTLLFLRLNDNHLSGTILRELSNLPSLKVLNLSHNNLSGPIPTTGPFVHIPWEK